MPRKKNPGPPSDDRNPESDDGRFHDLAGAIRDLISIPGVEDIGQPVMLISPGDLPMDLLALVERLRGGFIEVDEEMLLITLPESSVLGRGPETNPVVARIREALLILCRYAAAKGVSPEVMRTLLEARASELHETDLPSGEARK